MEDENKKYLSKKSKIIIIFALFILFFSALGLYYLIFAPNWNLLFFLSSSSNNIKENADNLILDSSNDNINICSNCPINWLNGLSMTNEKEAIFFPVAVVIDNDVLARPQSSLSLASLVYEAPVEGGMTRYLAIFPSYIELDRVGPIRSARPYFVVLAEELKALFVHCGGSPEALNLLKVANLYDLNEFYYGKYFWRESTMIAPHNVFTNSNKWQDYLNKRGLKESQAESWLFKQEVKPEINSLELKDIFLRFSTNFQVLWHYLPDSNSYQRYFNGEESKDDKGLIQAKNVIIQKVESKVLDEAGRLALNLKGEGEAEICLDGHCQLGFWRKKSNHRSRYYYQDGSEVQFNPGITWIEIADNNTEIKIE